MELFGFDGNPVPDGAVSGVIRSGDGTRLRFARWGAETRRPNGTICLFQGRSEAIEKYFETVNDLRRRGFAVATLDWRGQGASDRRLRNPTKGHVDTFGEYDRDLDAFMEQVALPDCPPPYYALAHSTGGLICLRAARQARVRFSRIVLSSPLVGLATKRPSPQTSYRIAAVLTAVGLGELSVPSSASIALEKMPFEDNPLTSDPMRFARNVEIVKRSPNIAVGAPTFAWLYAACRAMDEATAPDFGSNVKVPTLLVAGTLDKIVAPRAMEAVAADLRAGAQVVIAGARHELLMERTPLREQFWAAFDAFVPGTHLVGSGRR